MNNVIINKIQSIQRCVQRARAEFASDTDGFEANYTVQDAAILNVIRACEQTIDLANHIIKRYKMGVPSATAESFDLLRDQDVIDLALAEKLRRMVHFRNTAVHDYQRIELEIVKAVITVGLNDLLEFGDCILQFVHP
ncbi:MAG: DUF86 domain-containing protein [Anaerolineales bacterium]|nr:DUF86 domain-containing protein [Anaerolineales bacterium]